MYEEDDRRSHRGGHYDDNEDRRSHRGGHSHGPDYSFRDERNMSAANMSMSSQWAMLQQQQAMLQQAMQQQMMALNPLQFQVYRSLY